MTRARASTVAPVQLPTMWLRGLRLCLAAAVLSVAAGCSSPSEPDGSADPTAAARAPDLTSEYLPGLGADVYVPAVGSQKEAVPVVLLVPGGGWQTADRSGLAPLAADLAEAGFVAVNATYRAGDEGATFPVPVQDVLCASGYAVEAARSTGVAPGPLVVLGHSAGGHLASLAAIDAADLAAPCPYPEPRIDGLIGLAGVYDTRAFEFALTDFFGGTPAEQPEAWRQGDPVGLLDSGTVPQGLQVLLLHGDADDDVPLEQSQSFEASLTRAGVPVRLEVIPGATHRTIYSAEVAAPITIDWIAGLAAGRTTG
jgi:acetyl esterase/lipase